MPLGVGTVSVEFEEPDLAASIPGCAGVIAAALMNGYRLVPGPACNHEDVLVGCKRLQQFKDAKASQLRRVVKFHFLAGKRVIEGEETGVLDFVFVRWQKDKAFRRAQVGRREYEAWRTRLCELLVDSRRTVVAVEGERFAYGTVGGDSSTNAAMAEFMEEGVE